MNEEQPKKLHQVLEDAAKLVSFHSYDFSSIGNLDYQGILAKAAEIAPLQTRIKDVLIAQYGPPLQRLAKRTKIAFQKSQYDITELITKQYESIAFVANTMEGIKKAVSEAKVFVEDYWRSLTELPIMASNKKTNTLNRIEQLKQQLGEMASEEYDASTDPKGYFEYLRKKRTAEREIKQSIALVNRLSFFTRSIEESCSTVDRLCDYLQDIEGFATDWLMRITLAQSDFYLIKTMLPAVVTSADSFSTLVQLSDQIINITSELTERKLRESYKLLSMHGLKPLQAIVSRAPLASLEHLL